MAKNRMKITRLYDAVQPEEADKGKTRVAAYCRVSTKSDEQHTSYDTQVAVYTEKIQSEPGWTLAGIYADWGMSGTQAERRPQFLQMIQDCDDGKIDLVICKSVSRFSRNTLDAVNYIRHLRALGVRIMFEKEGIDTANAYSEMLLTVLAAFAQEESHSHSENVKWGKRKRALKGHELLISCYGYRKNEDGTNLEIVPEEAEAVRLIFDEYEHGTSVPDIAWMLNDKGYPMPDGKQKIWDESRIHYIISNEKYAGDLQTQKFYKKSYMDYRGYRNEGVLPSKYLKNHHEPIISRKQFERCNIILELKKKSTPSQYPFGDFLRCPYCGHVLHHRRLDIQNVDSHFCCEGEGACRQFVIMAIPAKEAILSAYNRINLVALQRICDMKLKRKAEEAKKLLEEKNRHPIMKRIDFWWLDEYVSKIEFGQHSHTATELEAMPKAADDRTITVTWKCGLTTTVPSGVVRDSQDPRHKAELWDGFILRYPARYPKLVEEVKRQKGLL
nr:recombinase family protein [Clostridia bacterium]